MTIIEEYIQSLPNPEFKIKKQHEPQSRNPNLPPQFFSLLTVGSKNSGKTYSITSLLKLYEQNDIYDINGNKLEQRIIIFSPTALNPNNNVFENLKYLDKDDIYTEYDDEILDEILKEIADYNKEVEENEKYFKLLKKYKNPKIELTDEEYILLFQNNYNENPEPLYRKITFFIFDDLIGDKNVFGKKRNNAINKFLLTHRHYYTNIIFTTQYVNAIPPLIKNNIDVYCLFKYANINDILKKFYPLVSGIMLEQQFKEMYLHSTKEKFNFLTIINHNGSKGRIEVRRGWNVNLRIQ